MDALVFHFIMAFVAIIDHSFFVAKSVVDFWYW
uniref:Uncharacterized protein n=1 Tax=Salmonella sp. TaxID=599 RepID=A0A482ETC7_SALSP|nr:hypothetical protein NNIBIDOC_00139 [Salmonella sp.]